MIVALELVVEDVEADSIPWSELGAEVEDKVAEVLGLDGDQVGLHVLDVTKDRAVDTIRRYRIHKLSEPHQVANALNARRELVPVSAWSHEGSTWLLTVETVDA